MKKSTKISTISLWVGFAGMLGMSTVSQSTRNAVDDILQDSRASHGMVVDRIEYDPSLSEEQRMLHVKIQTKYHLLSGNIENNKRFHGFWGLWGTKLPLFWDTENRLREIHGQIQTAKTEAELQKINEELKKLIDEFHVIMLKDEQEIQKELSEGIAHISASDREAIQSYMRECLGIIKNDLTVGDVSVDYTLTWGSNVENLLEAFINETDPDRINEILIKLVNNYRDIYADSDSELALHHMAEIAERLISGDSLVEITGRIVGKWVVYILGISLLIFAIFIMIKVAALASGAREIVQKLRNAEKWIHRVSGPSAAIWLATWDFLHKLLQRIQKFIKGEWKSPIKKDEEWRIIIDVDGVDVWNDIPPPLEPEQTAPSSDTPPPLN